MYISAALMTFLLVVGTRADYATIGGGFDNKMFESVYASGMGGGAENYMLVGWHWLFIICTLLRNDVYVGALPTNGCVPSMVCMNLCAFRMLTLRSFLVATTTPFKGSRTLSAIMP